MATDKKKETVETTITPSQYFDHLKGAKQVITTQALKDSYNTFIQLGEKYKKLGQLESLRKLCFLADTLTKEEKLIELGITTYVYKDTIEDYIQNVADKTVKIIELSRYMREIPDEFVDTIEKSKELFDELYVVFTDYTGKEERKVEKERRDKDPILFGAFRSNTSVADRFYFLGDWIDEYCDLTLDKMVEQYKAKNEVTPAHETRIPKSSEELVEIMKSYKTEVENSKITLNATAEGNPISVVEWRDTPTKHKPEKGFFKKIRSVFSK